MPSRKMMARRRETTRRVERMILAGETRTSEIALALGITPQMVNKHKTRIRERWQLEAAGDDIEARRAEATHRNLLVFREAMDGFKRSKKNKERISTKYDPVPCQACAAHPTFKRPAADRNEDREPCDCCDGTGRQLVEVITKDSEGQPGNPAFLNVALKAQREASELAGLIKSKGDLHLTNVTMAGKDLKAELRALGPEKLLELRIKAEDMIEAAKTGVPLIEVGREIEMGKEIEGQVVSLAEVPDSDILPKTPESEAG